MKVLNTTTQQIINLDFEKAPYLEKFFTVFANENQETGLIEADQKLIDEYLQEIEKFTEYLKNKKEYEDVAN